jgi:hypothetical protein
MSNELIIPTKADDQSFDLAVANGNYLPRVSLKTSNSQQCKDGTFSVNHFAFEDGSIIKDLGQEINVLVVSWRPIALEIIDGQPHSVYDASSAEFKRIQDKAGEPESGCLYGIEFLIWLPAIKKFGTFGFTSKSSRKEAPICRALLGKWASISAKKIQTARFTWFSPSVKGSSIPGELPTPEVFEKAKSQWENPTPAKGEPAPAADGRAR